MTDVPITPHDEVVDLAPSTATDAINTDTEVTADHTPNTKDDTGEMEQIAGLREPSAFDYESYYGVDPEWGVAAAPAVPAATITPDPTPPSPPRRRGDTALFFVGALAAGVLGAALTVGVLAASGTLSSENAATSTTVTTAQTAGIDTSEPGTITNTIINNELGSAVNPTAVAEKSGPSIVTVTTFNPDTAGSAGDLVGVGSGSGVVLTEDGYIATNNHVVENAADYKVTFEDGRVYTATLIGTDALTDVAVLKIDTTGLTPIEIGSVDALHLGDPAVAFGNPLGQEGGSSISVGIISAFDRRVDFGDGSSLFGMIQTDAAINSGSSGGALLNSDGALIGITSAIGVSNAGPEGIGYAIPVDLVMRIADEIIETGDVEHPFLGVTIATYEETLSDGAVAPRGAEVVTIEGTDSAAGMAGLEEGDVIIAIGDEDITSQTDLILAVRLYRVGDEVTFTALRNGEPMDFTVVMGQRPAEFGG